MMFAEEARRNSKVYAVRSVEEAIKDATFEGRYYVQVYVANQAMPEVLALLNKHFYGHVVNGNEITITW